MIKSISVIYCLYLYRSYIWSRIVLKNIPLSISHLLIATFYSCFGSQTFLNMPPLSYQMLESLRAWGCVWSVFVLFIDHICPPGWERVSTDFCLVVEEGSDLGADRTIIPHTACTHSTKIQLCGLHTPWVINYSLLRPRIRRARE